MSVDAEYGPAFFPLASGRARNGMGLRERRCHFASRRHGCKEHGAPSGTRGGACLAWVLALWSGAASADLPALQGSVAVETRVFAESPEDPNQARDTAAVLLNPVWKARFGSDEAWELEMSPYARIDARDKAARYVDLRVASLEFRERSQMFRVGFDNVFWGVAESNHLVDIINQVDPRADVELEAKLGQPMVSYTRFLDSYGRVEVFWLPYFRPRPGIGEKGRQRLEVIPESQQTHGLGRLLRRDDWAVRWSGQIASADVGLYIFKGVGREPDFSRSTEGDYHATRQLGMTLQLPQGSMLWKLEALRRSGQGRTFNAYVAGGEYTIARPSGDLGLLLEWSQDFRDGSAPPSRFARSLFGGVRYRVSESGDGEILFGVLHDLRHNTRSYKVEFSRRLSDHVKLGLVARKFVAPADSPFAALRRDANVQMTLSWSF